MVTGRPTEFVPRRRRCRRLWLTLACLLLLAITGTDACRRATAASAPPSRVSRRAVPALPRNRAKEVDGLTPSSPIAHQPLAMQRYRMLRQIERQLGAFPLYYGTQGYVWEVLFPRGRSDKVYLYGQFGWNWDRLREHRDDELLCFATEGSVAKFRYSVKLKEVKGQPPTRRTPPRSMRDFIDMLGVGARPREAVGEWPRPYRYILSAHTSRSITRDLSLRREWVAYWYDPVVNVLYVAPLRSMTAMASFAHRQSFYLGQHQENNEAWFRTYGLPLAAAELPRATRSRR